MFKFDESPGFNPEAKHPIDVRVAEWLIDALQRQLDPSTRAKDKSICEIVEWVQWERAHKHPSAHPALINHRWSATTDWVYYAFQSWPKFSGRKMYPVPGEPSASVAFSIATEAGDYYAGTYGEDRLDLIRYMIDDLKTNACDRNYRAAIYIGDDKHLKGLEAMIHDRLPPRGHRVAARFNVATLLHPARNFADGWYDFGADEFEPLEK